MVNLLAAVFPQAGRVIGATDSAYGVVVEPNNGVIFPWVGTYDGSEVVYTVQPGDTLEKIAAMYNISLEILIEYNGLQNPYLLYPGQTIIIPPADLNWEHPYAPKDSSLSSLFLIIRNTLFAFDLPNP
ncbi:MAG: LysM peptidoglycan-binding domain-containing protein [Candidatus Omnitrophica bacterium]|nr:LysM peptidoglycan-binding domain-containing protein [Candidatus Omnitrophota bacterium]